MNIKRKAIVIENNLSAAETIGKLLKNYHNMDVNMSTNANTAVLAIQDFQPQIVFTEVNHFGEADNFHVIHEIRKTSGISEIPIVVVTDLKAKEDIIKAQHYGVKHYFVKPIDDGQFNIRVDQILKTIPAPMLF